jgi:heme A synthase
MTISLANSSPSSAPGLKGPFRLAIAMVCVTTVTILWGALTTSTGSGLAFTDWPTSDGEFMPERSYKTLPGFLEHFHRLFGATAGILALWLALWLHFGQRGSKRVRATAWFGGVLILTQGLFGGIGVLKGLPAVTSVTHGTLAQLTLATFVWAAYQLSNRYRDTPIAAGVEPGSGRKLVGFAVLVLIVQTVIGALARHTNSEHALWTHVGNAIVVFLVGAIAAAFAIGRLGDSPGIRPLAQSIVVLLILQIALGFVALAIRNDAGKTPENVANLGTASVISIHVLFGAMLTVLMVALAAHVFRATRSAQPS